jgi:hypothetical protein
MIPMAYCGIPWLVVTHHMAFHGIPHGFIGFPMVTSVIPMAFDDSHGILWESHGLLKRTMVFHGISGICAATDFPCMVTRAITIWRPMISRGILWVFHGRFLLGSRFPDEYTVDHFHEVAEE